MKEKESEEGRHIKYKMRKIQMPVCPDCDETLAGNNSWLDPYKCYKCNVIWTLKNLVEYPYLYVKTNINEQKD